MNTKILNILTTIMLLSSVNSRANLILDSTKNQTNKQEIVFKSDLSFDNAISSASKTGLIFQIQIFKSNRILDHSMVENVEPVFVERSLNLNKHYYFVGQFRTLEAAILAKRELISIGYDGAKIVAYLDGIKIALFKAKNLIDQQILMSDNYYKSLVKYELGYLNKSNDSNSLSYTDINYNVDKKYSRAELSYDLDISSKTNSINQNVDVPGWAFDRTKAYDKNPYWKLFGNLNLNFTQQALTDWTQGGVNFISLITDNKFNANYQKDGVKWENYIQERLVYTRNEGEEFQKKDEKFEINSIVGIEAIGSWFYELKFNLKSQLFPAYKVSGEDEILISDLFSPGEALFALGMEYDPSVNFSILISPLTYKSIFVMNTDDINVAAFDIDEGSSAKFNFGSSSEINLTVPVTPNFQVKSKLLLFSDYVENINNIDFDGELILTYRVSNYFTIQLSNYAIYKENQNINIIKNKKVAEGFRDGIQYKEFFTLGLRYDF